MAKFNLNEASLLCKVGKEPEKRSTQSGLVVVSLLCVTVAPSPFKGMRGPLDPGRALLPLFAASLACLFVSLLDV